MTRVQFRYYNIFFPTCGLITSIMLTFSTTSTHHGNSRQRLWPMWGSSPTKVLRILLIIWWMTLHIRWQITPYYLSVTWPFWYRTSLWRNLSHTMMNIYSITPAKWPNYWCKIVHYVCMLPSQLDNLGRLSATVKANNFNSVTWEWHKVTQRKIKHSTHRLYNHGEEEHMWPQFGLLILPAPFNESPKTCAEGSHSYAHLHSKQHFWTRKWRPV